MPCFRQRLEFHWLTRWIHVPCGATSQVVGGLLSGLNVHRVQAEAESSRDMTSGSTSPAKSETSQQNLDLVFLISNLHHKTIPPSRAPKITGQTKEAVRGPSYLLHPPVKRLLLRFFVVQATCKKVHAFLVQHPMDVSGPSRKRKRQSANASCRCTKTSATAPRARWSSPLRRSSRFERLARVGLWGKTNAAFCALPFWWFLSSLLSTCGFPVCIPRVWFSGNQQLGAQFDRERNFPDSVAQRNWRPRGLGGFSSTCSLHGCSKLGV